MIWKLECYLEIKVYYCRVLVMSVTRGQKPYTVIPDKTHLFKKMVNLTNVSTVGHGLGALFACEY